MTQRYEVTFTVVIDSPFSEADIQEGNLRVLNSFMPKNPATKVISKQASMKLADTDSSPVAAVPKGLFTGEMGYVCDDCEAIAEEEGPALYECGDCGEVFNRNNSANDNHQCPQCNKFGSKKADASCMECEVGELKAVFTLECECHHETHVVGDA